jgi:hypothetical protein
MRHFAPWTAQNHFTEPTDAPNICLTCTRELARNPLPDFQRIA